ncbi:type I polyketide synthase [Breoghania sp. L-A4]|uniref:type I polyketide synthase n=1 Tax=Breoghania sp. L-A4 TaxID=2304600 RepID=UPI000E35E595|nr:type I polyketide synthase [Breoghania sp. L-A4]AXS40353.1 SDR family NAD(P)-dependent oxidoreductase [Breoghania sp. L-A4]
MNNQEISIVGYATRLPSAPDNGAFWSLLESGTCAISQVSEDRWPLKRFLHPRRGEPGKTYTWAAGQIDDPWGFDPAFFGISPREAIQADPQQRLLLQVVWEALEHAHIPPESLAGSATGVYVGASALDYSHRFLLDPSAGDVQFMTGNTLSIISNRISYIYDLRGPSFTVDTACSSSLLALHEASEAIRAGRIDTAIVAGVNLLLSPFSFIGFSRASMLSPTGLCRAFDAGGDGYVRSEGAVVLVLRSAEKARVAGDVERARLVATGINADGRTVGMSLPSGESQAELLRAVYRDFELDPGDLAFVEAHGTGTQVGDPAEAFSLGEALGKHRAAALPIGSVKTNIGHLEPASGLAGVVKAIMALDHDLVPASLHFDTPNPNIDFDGLNLTVTGEALPIARGETPRLAGINSFGFGGTNAHAVISDPPRRLEPAGGSAHAPLVLSAASQDALKALAQRYGDHLDGVGDDATAAMLASAAYCREALAHRLVVMDTEARARIGTLHAFAGGEKPATAITGQTTGNTGPVVFAFTGNGSQWAGMGCVAYKGDRTFRAAFDRIDRQFMRLSGWSLATMLFSKDLESEIDRTEIAQPLLFAVQGALVDALEKQGVTPDAVIGHSVGEVAAAWTAGIVDLDDAVRIIHTRSTCQEITKHLGSMAALLLPGDEAEAALAASGLPGLQVAAVNSPRSVTISGPTDSLDAFGQFARKNRWALRRLDIDYPFHCALVDPIETPLIEALEGLNPRAPKRTFLSTVYPDRPDPVLDARYWWDNVRKPVLFADAMARLLEDGAGVIVEIGPNPLLTTYIRDIARETGKKVAIVTSFDRKNDRPDAVPAIAAAVFANGGAVDKARLFGPAPRVPAPLPHYPWQNQLYRPDATTEGLNSFSGTTWPLLGYQLQPDLSEWFNILDPEIVPWLADHKVEEAVVFPAAGYFEMALRAAKLWLNSETVEIRDVDILRPLVFEPDSSYETRLRMSADDSVFEISSRPRLTDGEWSLHVRGSINVSPATGAAPRLGQQPALVASAMDDTALYALTRQFGLNYGDAFQRGAAVTTHDDRSATLTLKPPTAAVSDSVSGTPFSLDPTLLDAGFHGLFALLRASGETPANTSFLPVRLGRMRLTSDAQPATVRIRVDKASRRSIEATFEFLDHDGGLVARLSGTRFRAVALGRSERPDELTYRTIHHALAQAGGVSAAREAVAALSDLAPESSDDADGGPEEALLLLEALAQSVALDALRGLTDGETIDPDALRDAGMLAASAEPLVVYLLHWLEDTGLATPVPSAEDSPGDGGVWRLADGEDLPQASTLLRTITQEAPERIAELSLLARLRDDLPALLHEGLPDTAAAHFSTALFEQFRTASPSYQPLADAIESTMRALAGRWPEREPLRVLSLSAGDPALNRRLAGLLDPANATLTISDPDASVVSRATRIWHGPALANHTPLEDLLSDDAPLARFDVLVGPDMLARLSEEQLAGLRKRLAPGALLIAAEYTPAPLIELLQGIGANWWAQGQDPRFPVTPLRDGAQWCKALGDAGFCESHSATLETPAIEAALLLARAPEARIVKERTEPADTTTDGDQSDAPAPGAAIVLIHDGTRSSQGLAEALAHRLQRCGRPATLLNEDSVVSESGADALQPFLDADADIVHLAGAFVSAKTAAPHPTAANDDAVDAMDVAGKRTIALKGLLRHIGGAQTRLWLLAPGAMQQQPADQRPAQAAVWAFGRTAMNEYPNAAVRLIDVSPALEPGEMAIRLADEILNPDEEREIIRGMDGRSGLRILRGGILDDDTPEGRDARGIRLDIDHQGSLDYLRWRRAARPEPAGDDIEIEVRASGLNFRDVMWALGLLPEEALEDGFAGPTLGMECSGVVTRAGPQARRFKEGDTVLTFAPACFASHVCVSETACAPMPAGVSFDAAATIPVTFLTAYYALAELARLADGETVLIHGGAGGVGLAALQIAKARGARIIATAGTPEKRSFLKLLGVDHVLDSRSLDFAEEVMELTDDQGVDVVLNSLFGEAMERSIQVLKPFGRFLELGKRDYFGNTRIGLRPFRQNLSYFGIDADQLLTRQPQLAQRLFAELVALFEDGVLTPLPFRRFDPHSVVDAFRVMQQSGHIGKIVLRPPQPPADKPQGSALAFEADGTHVIAGGFGGFGAELLRLLVRKGARHLLVASRSGATSEAAQTVISELEDAGATVQAVACDVTDRAALAAVLDNARSGMPPIRGVYHTAMVLEDALLANLSDDAMTSVMAPKIRGAENLEVLTRSDPLETFVLFSSATTLVGNPGQANYVAANGYLEALATKRRAEGLPALAIAWGAISDAGYLARNNDVNELLARKLGRHSLTAAEAMDGLERLLARSRTGGVPPAVGFARIDWSAARRDLALLNTPLVGMLGLSASGQDLDAEGVIDLKALLDGLDPLAATQTVARLLGNEIGRILRIAPEELDPHRPLSEIGMDSLMALELRMGAERQLGVDIPLMSLANGATLNDLAARIASRVTKGEDASAMSAEARNLAGQHFGDAAPLDAEEAAQVAAKVEERSSTIGKLVQ